MLHPDEGKAQHMDDKARADEAAYRQGAEEEAKANDFQGLQRRLQRVEEEKSRALDVLKFAQEYTTAVIYRSGIDDDLKKAAKAVNDTIQDLFNDLDEDHD